MKYQELLKELRYIKLDLEDIINLLQDENISEEKWSLIATKTSLLSVSLEKMADEYETKKKMYDGKSYLITIIMLLEIVAIVMFFVAKGFIIGVASIIGMYYGNKLLFKYDVPEEMLEPSMEEEIQNLIMEIDGLMSTCRRTLSKNLESEKVINPEINLENNQLNAIMIRKREKKKRK